VRRALLLVLLLAACALGGDKTTLQVFGRGGGRAWRSAPPASPSCKAELEGKSGAVVFDAAKGAESYLLYFFEKQPILDKGQEEKFWKGDLDGFVAGVEVTPRAGAPRFTVVDPNERIGWRQVYVFSVEAKSRKLIAASWKEGVQDPGEDGGKLGEKYRAKK